MKTILTAFILFFYFFLFGQNEDSLLLLIEQIEITRLSTDEEHQEFLEYIWDIDQGIRKTETHTIKEFGYGSAEHDSILTKWVGIDRYLFNSIREYLSIYPYPKKNDFGWYANSVPILVFHHVAGTPEDIDLKRLYFPIFFSAYKKHDISENQIWMYLYRLYSQINKNDYVNQELGDEDQIEEMIILLDLKREQ